MSLLPADTMARDDGSWLFSLPDGHPAFVDHFPGFPILPGVAHVALALQAAQRRRQAVLIGVRAVRFLRPIGPGEDIELVLGEELLGSTRFELRTREGVASRGELLLAEPAT